MNTSDAASSTSLSHSHPQYQASTSFPDGKGDITLLAVDNVIFHVHRAVLQHSSSVFETIFEAGSVKDEEKQAFKQPLKVEADARTLDVLLRYIYPNRCSPIIEDVNLLASVFRAAKRYEMEGVSDQLRRGLMETRVTHQKIIPPLYIRYPFSIMAISHAFGCYDEARVAMKECIKGDLKAHMEGALDLDAPVSLMATIIRLRENRASWFQSKLDKMPWPSNSCIHCCRKCAEWRFQLERRAMLELDFEAMRRGLETQQFCPAGHEIARLVVASTLSSWLEEWKIMEENLPPLLDESSE
ncbi:hypothetical protein FRC14_000738 [Serendipita sp. 396]